MKTKSLIPNPTDHFSFGDWQELTAPLVPIAQALANINIGYGWYYKSDSRWPLVSLVRRKKLFHNERISLALQPNYLQDGDLSWVLAKSHWSRMNVWLGSKNSGESVEIKRLSSSAISYVEHVVALIRQAAQSEGP